MAITLQDFRTRVAALDSLTFETTARRRPFVLHVEDGGLRFAISTGKQRRHDWSDVERVLERYEQCRTFNPSQYTDVTFNASYVLAVLRKLVEDSGGPPSAA